MTKNKITAVLGPTNTGKTFLAIETMLSFSSGMMGFPLRLLAREVYDKVVKKTDPNKVALIMLSHSVGQVFFYLKKLLKNVQLCMIFVGSQTTLQMIMKI